MANVAASISDFLGLLVKLALTSFVFLIIFGLLKRFAKTWFNRILYIVDLGMVLGNSIIIAFLAYIFVLKDMFSKGKALVIAYLIVALVLTLMTCQKLEKVTFVFKAIYSLIDGYYLAETLTHSAKFAEKFGYVAGNIPQTVLVYIVTMGIVWVLLMGATIKGFSITQEISIF